MEKRKEFSDLTRDEKLDLVQSYTQTIDERLALIMWLTPDPPHIKLPEFCGVSQEQIKEQFENFSTEVLAETKEETFLEIRLLRCTLSFEIDKEFRFCKEALLFEDYKGSMTEEDPKLLIPLVSLLSN